MDTTDNLPLSLPVVTIQHTFPQVIQEVKDGVIPYDKFWVSCYRRSETSVHAEVHVELDEVDRDLVSLKSSEKDVEVKRDAEGVSELLDSFR
jgi:proteasomal ATPase-associated factor 1